MNPTQIKDLYERLGVSPTARPEEIRLAYRTSALRWHPDKNHGSEESALEMRALNEAHSILCDHESRRAYDTDRIQNMEWQNLDDFGMFRNFYRKVRTKQSKHPFIRPGYNFEPTISYRENGEQKSTTEFDCVIELADKKQKGIITDIRMSPAYRGELAGLIYRSLKIALDPEQRDHLWAHDELGGVILNSMYLADLGIRRALKGMYLADLTNNRTLLHMIETALEDDRNYWAVETIAPMFKRFGIVDEYYSDLVFEDPGPYGNDREVIRAVLRDKLRPKKPRNDEEAFNQGFQEVYPRKEHDSYWGESLNTAKIAYTQKGERESRRLGWLSVSKLADKIMKDEIANVELPPREQGKLYGSIRRSIDLLQNPGRHDCKYPDSEETSLFLRETMAGLYILGRLNDEETKDMFASLLNTRPELRDGVEKELSRYA